MTHVYTALSAAGGLLAGIILWHIFRSLPAGWLLDYGESEISEELKQKQELPVYPDAVLLGLGEALLFILLKLSLGIDLYFFAVILAVQPLVLIMIADQKTRIIPDQFLISLIPAALLVWISRSLSGQEEWFSGLIWRFAAALAGGLLLLFCGWAGEKLLRREAMGMGDVKLIAACGLLVGLKQLPLLLVLSFISAAFLAFPLLIRRMRNSERDAEMAFGPFISFAGILVLGFSQFFTNLWQAYINLLAG